MALRDFERGEEGAHKGLPVVKASFCAAGEACFGKMKTLATINLWSALPTPLTTDLQVDEAAVGRLVGDAVDGGFAGVFLAGTCGEGPWLPDRERIRLVTAAAAAAEGRLTIGAQVSDNSVPRVLENIEQMARAGADVAILAAPTTFLNATADRVAGFFLETLEASALPVGVYDLGRHRPIAIPLERLEEIYGHPRVALVKDSSGSPERRSAALAAQALRPDLQLFNGDEFKCLDYLLAGYNGCMFGGAVAVAAEMREVVRLFLSGHLDEARRVEQRMIRVLFGIYGGETIECWLTGLKYSLVRRGLIPTTASFLGYPLTETCRAFIEADVSERHGGVTAQVR